MHVMIDLETIGQQSDAGMATIGAIQFGDKSVFDLFEDYPTLEDLQEKMNTFYVRVNLKSLYAENFNWSKSTTEWWLGQEPAMRYEALDAKPRTHVREALTNFYNWYPVGDLAWSHGASFDLVIMRNGLERIGLSTPWKFWDERCTRTLYDIAKIDSREQKELRGDHHHHALFDCFDQIVIWETAMERIKNV